MSKKLTISLVVYNGEKYLSSCLDSIFRQTFENWELVIFDNHSKDNSVKVIKSKIVDYGHKIRLIQNEKNIGFAAGHNLVMDSSEGEYALILNQDVVLEPDYCEKIIRFMDENQKVGAVSGKILRLTNGAKTDIIDTLGLKIFKSFQVVDIGSGQKDSGHYDNEQEIFGVSGCCAIYRRKALERVGLFDQVFFNYKEDVDLAFRLQYADCKAFRAGEAIAYHERSVGDNNRKDRADISNYLSYRNHLFMLIKNLSWPDFGRYGIFIIWYEFKKFIYLLLFEQKTLYAWIEVVSKFKGMRGKRAGLSSVRKWIK